VAKAKAASPGTTPGVTVEFVAQPFDQYYTLLGAAIQAAKDQTYPLQRRRPDPRPGEFAGEP
jgi:hypothetical protein